MNSKYHDAVILASTPDQRYLGIRIFPMAYRKNGVTYQQYLAACVMRAVKLQKAIECGTFKVHSQATTDPRFMLNPPIQPSDIHSLQMSKSNCKSRLIAIPNETELFAFTYPSITLTMFFSSYNIRITDMNYVRHMEKENLLVCLGYQLMYATQRDNLQLDICSIVLAEMNGLY